MFTNKEKADFKPYVKIKFDADLSIRNAMISAYLDVCRGPLRGIRRIIQEYNSDFTSFIVRNKFIDEIFIPRVDELSNSECDFDKWHKELSDKIIEFYKEYGYEDMTYGKAQKWINMSIKYIILYTVSYQEKLMKYKYEFHVPIDRYVAPSIAGLIGFLPNDNSDKDLNHIDGSFDAEKQNYCWSNIDNYYDYLRCQKEIRNSLPTKAPLKWEYDEWKKEKEK